MVLTLVDAYKLNRYPPYAEGLNGRLPNQDLINSLRLISHYTGGVPLVLYDHLELRDAPQSSLLENAPEFMKRSPQLRDFEYRARNVKRHVSYQARGRPSGAHGLFHRRVANTHQTQYQSIELFNTDFGLMQLLYMPFRLRVHTVSLLLAGWSFLTLRRLCNDSLSE